MTLNVEGENSVKVIVINNPKSGLKVRKNQNKIIEILKTSKVEYSYYLTRKEFNAYNIVLSLVSEPDLIIVSGGDGTISEVNNGMYQKGFKSSILVIPTGTSNEIVKNLEYNLSDLLKLNFRDEKHVRKIDAGLLNDERIFSYSLTFGTFTSITYKTPQRLKNIFGYYGYIIYGFFSFRRLNSEKIRVSFENNEIEGNFTFGAITSSFTLGNIIDLKKINPRLDDGLFEILLIKKPKSFLEYRNILAGIKNGDYGSDLFIVLKTSKLTIQSESAIEVNIDGDYGGSYKTIEVENLRKYSSFVVGN